MSKNRAPIGQNSFGSASKISIRGHVTYLELSHPLPRTKLEAEESCLLSDLLARCSNVVLLSLHTVCDDSMLHIVAHTCSHLAHLGQRCTLVMSMFVSSK